MTMNIAPIIMILIPLIVIQYTLMIISLIHVFKHKTYRAGNRTLWVILCIAVSIIGPVLYFAIGKGDE